MDEGAENGANADTSASETDRGKTGTVHLGRGDDGSGGRLDDNTPALHGIADHGRGKRVAGAIEHETMAASQRLLASSRDDGAWDASWSRDTG